jgi:hypothetical protein
MSTLREKGSKRGKCGCTGSSVRMQMSSPLALKAVRKKSAELSGNSIMFIAHMTIFQVKVICREDDILWVYRLSNQWATKSFCL